MRPNGRNNNQLRQVEITRNYTKYAEGSALIKIGNTHVLCTASVDKQVPKFLKGQGSGWLTAEYGMLPRATSSRTIRESAKGKQTGRSQEIQRLIGRALRSSINMKKLGEYTITIDCDVIQADGSTRTAAITGAYIALHDAIYWMENNKLIDSINVLRGIVSAVSVGIVNGEAVLDLEYIEDSKADTDMNIVMDQQQNFIEIQGTAEKQAYSYKELEQMLELAKQGNSQLQVIQKQVINSK